MALAALVATTLVALEGREVVVLETIDGAGVARATRTWVADDDGYAWIEAANPERPFLLARRYGWADRWIGLLADTSGSVAVRLACE